MHNRKLSVLLTAQQLFSEKGFLATSVQDILDDSDISKGTFYNYFSSKNECLIAILEHGQDEVANRRKEILIGQDRASKKILAKQISIRLEVNREFNLFPIFQAVFHSGDANLKAFVDQHQFRELSWLANRLIDVYGEYARPFVSDFAIIMHGIMQHMIHSWRMIGSKEGFSTLELVNFTMRRLDSIVEDMIETNDTFLGDALVYYEDINIKDDKITKRQLLNELTMFKERINEKKSCGRQYTQFLIEEIEKHHPRIHLMETVIQSLRKTFINTTYELEARNIATHIWNYIDTLNQDSDPCQ